ncbi:hypothetical protein C8R45DRAFT_929794 [Mycena sanguinolenta]|nr:hypothetical protein C8R45DRAFT_929794 [Mycena sanguinolenta]
MPRAPGTDLKPCSSSRSLQGVHRLEPTERSVSVVLHSPPGSHENSAGFRRSRPGHPRKGYAALKFGTSGRKTELSHYTATSKSGNAVASDKFCWFQRRAASQQQNYHTYSMVKELKYGRPLLLQTTTPASSQQLLLQYHLTTSLSPTQQRNFFPILNVFLADSEAGSEKGNKVTWDRPTHLPGVSAFAGLAARTLLVDVPKLAGVRPSDYATLTDSQPPCTDNPFGGPGTKDHIAISPIPSLTVFQTGPFTEGIPRLFDYAEHGKVVVVGESEASVSFTSVPEVAGVSFHEGRCSIFGWM